MPTTFRGPGGESERVDKSQADRIRELKGVRDETKEILKDVSDITDQVKEVTEDQLKEIKAGLEEVRLISEEIGLSWEGSLGDLTNMARVAKEMLVDTGGIARVSTGLTRQLSSEVQRQISLQATGENITRQSIATRRRAVAGFSSDLQALAETLNIKLGNISDVDLDELSYEIDAEKLKIAQKLNGVYGVLNEKQIKELVNRRKALDNLSNQVNIMQTLNKSVDRLDEAWNSQLRVVGNTTGKLELYSKLASKVGLGGLGERIKTAKSDAEAAYNRKFLERGNEGEAKAAYDAALGEFSSLPGILKAAGSEISAMVTSGMLALTLAIEIFRNLLKFDQEAVNTKRTIGQWADASAVANTSFVTGTEVLKTMNQLGQQFGINPVQVFDPEELGRIAQAQKLTGMTAEAAGNLAIQSKITGKNANTYRDEIAKGANAANANFHSATNLSKVQNDVLNTSRAIALSYGNGTQRLAEAAGAAAALGMNLQDVEGIAKNLMNFQSSIEAEMQAQLLTGMQLNLAKAREYALNNDLKGVAEEIKNQGVDAAKFSHMNYIQQENMAKALGMSREQMAKMLIMQEINAGLSAKQVAAMTGMRKEDIEAISAQEKWQTMKQRFLEMLVPLLEPVLQLTSDLLIPITWIVGSLTKAVAWVARFGNLIDEDNKFLRGLWSTAVLIASVIAVNWIRGLRGVELLGVRVGGIFRKIGTAIKGSNTSILNWISSLGKAKVAAQATDAVFDKNVGRWRNVKTGRFVKTPVADAVTSAPKTAGPSAMGKTVSSLGKNIGNILKGAAAAAILAGAVFILAKACQEFAKIDGLAGALFGAVVGVAALAGAVVLLGQAEGELIKGALAAVILAGAVGLLGLALGTFKGLDWGTVLKGIVSLTAFTVAMVAIGALMDAGGIVLVAGAALAMAMLAGAVALVGLSLKVLQGISWETIGKLPVAMLALTAAGALALVAGPSLLIGSELLLVGALAFAAATIPLGRAFKRISNLGKIDLPVIDKLNTLVGLSGGLQSVANSIERVAEAVQKLSQGLEGVSTLKLAALTGLKVAGTVDNLVSGIVGSKGTEQESVTTTATTAATKRIEAQMNSQQATVEQKAADLSRIEQKMDELKREIRNSRPDWNWLEFNQAMGRETPGLKTA